MGPNSGEPVVLSASDIKRFWARVVKTDGCWVWAGNTNTGGYGNLMIAAMRRPVMAHRLAYTITRGEIPAGMCVLHSCDNPPCVDPDHLRIGTQKDNMADRSERGRFVSQWANATHCKHGHLFGLPNENGHRSCAKCMVLRDAEKAIERREDWRSRAIEVLAPLMASGAAGLKFREIAFIRSYFGLDGCEIITLEDMATLWGITRERVRQIRNRGLERLGTTIEEVDAKIGTFTMSKAA